MNNNTKKHSNQLKLYKIANPYLEKARDYEELNVDALADNDLLAFSIYVFVFLKKEASEDSIFHTFTYFKKESYMDVAVSLQRLLNNGWVKEVLNG